MGTDMSDRNLRRVVLQDGLLYQTGRDDARPASEAEILLWEEMKMLRQALDAHRATCLRAEMVMRAMFREYKRLPGRWQRKLRSRSVSLEAEHMHIEAERVSDTLMVYSQF